MLVSHIQKEGESFGLTICHQPSSCLEKWFCGQYYFAKNFVTGTTKEFPHITYSISITKNI